MPVPDYKTYCKMIDRALEGKFAYPAINVSSLTMANAVLKGLAESKSDGIVQVSTGGGAFASGSSLKDMALGAISLAEHVHRVAARYPIYAALHTDHCPADKLESFMIPLIEETERRRAMGLPNLFNSHMFDGSALRSKLILTSLSLCWNAATRMSSSWRSKWELSVAKRMVCGEKAPPKSSTRRRRT